MDSPRNVTVFMLGLSQNPKVQRVLFVFFLIVYLVSVGGNLLLMITIVFSPTLGSPMYIFLSCLSFIDICYSSCMNPKLIADSLYEGRTITFKGFLAQLFVAHLLGRTEIILLTVMAYGHYMGICKPLHYTAVMTGIPVFCWWGWLGWGASCIPWLSPCWSCSCPSVGLT